VTADDTWTVAEACEQFREAGVPVDPDGLRIIIRRSDDSDDDDGRPPTCCVDGCDCGHGDARSVAPYMDRIVNLRCRLTYAQQRVRELEALLADLGIPIPADVAMVPPIDHRC
jgi:hypothetical protein